MTNALHDVQWRIDAAERFEDWYSVLEGAIPRVHLTPTEETRPLVRSDNNPKSQIHRWFTLKEAFAAELAGWLLRWMEEKYDHMPAQICDPFLGGGTTGVSLFHQARSVSGVEYNPFIRFVAATKARIPQVEPDELEQAIHVLKTTPPLAATVPALTTLHNRKYSDETDLQFLLGTVQRIREHDTGTAAWATLRLGVAAAIEDTFNLRKDGRALRYIPKSDRAPVRDLVLARWRNILEDVRCYHERRHPGMEASPLYHVYEGSAVDLGTLRATDGTPASFPDGAFDTVIYSPPYANDFDYSEVYKLELWILGFLKNYDEWTQLRRGTLRSHRSITFPSTCHLVSDLRTQEVAAHIHEMVESPCLPESERGRVRRLIEGYFDDMYCALREQWRVLRAGGLMVYVVSNSRHYYLPLATDLILAEIARCIGFEPLDLVVLEKRNGRTRQKQFLRESVVFFRKPASVY